MIAISYGMAFHELLAGCSAASLSLLVVTWCALSRRLIASLSLVIAAVAGNVGAFAYANFVYVEFTDLPTGYNHEFTAWINALLCWSIVIGAGCVHVFVRREVGDFRTELIDAWQTLALAGVIFGVLAIMFVIGGEADARWEGGEKTGLRYYAYAVANIAYVFFFLLGRQMRGDILSTRNLGILSFVSALAFTQGLTGGREYSVLMYVFLLLGASMGGIPRRSLVILGGVLFLSGALFIAVIGVARDNAHFAFGSFDDRMNSISEAATQTIVAESATTDPVSGVAGRIFEMAAQDVIDQTLATQRFAGFEHIERLKFLFTPRALAPDKPELDDGREVLMRDFGYRITGNTGIPLPLVADAFRRGGIPWVAAVGFVMGVWLPLLSRLALLVTGAAFAPVVLAMLSITYFRSYPVGVLGMVGMLTYVWLKTVALVTIFLWMARILVLLTNVGHMNPGRFRSAP